MSRDGFPFVSVIIPVCDGGEELRLCLEALQATVYPAWECIVVDDGSTDGSAELARRYGARVISGSRARAGPADARNRGARLAQGSLLLFIDADVLVRPDTVGRVAEILCADPGLAACFGSYDDMPGAPNFLSQYKNLMHHYVHQTSHEEASTFWAGCGAIRRRIFLEMGGFSVSYGRPSIEDIELGYRLRAAGYRIRLDKQLQVQHLKRWTTHTLLLAEIRDRAIPWTRLILQEGSVLNDLNLQVPHRLSVIATFVGIMAAFASLKYPWAVVLVGLSVVTLLALNWPSYCFLANRRGAWFALRALPWHWLYYVYSGSCFGMSLLWFWLSRSRDAVRRTARLEGESG